MTFLNASWNPIMKLTKRIQQCLTTDPFDGAVAAALNGLTLPSLEEEIIATVNTQNAMNTAESVADEIYDVTNKVYSADVLEQYVERRINNKSTGATENEVALAEQAVYAILSGTDQSENSVPSFESYVGSKISLEDFKSTAKELLTTLGKLLEILFDNIDLYWHNMVTRVGSLGRTAKEIRQEAKRLAGRNPTEDKIEVPLSISSTLSVGGKTPKDFETIQSSFDSLLFVMMEVFGVWGIPVVEKGNEINRILTNAVENTVEESISEINTITDDLINAVPAAYQKKRSLLGGKEISFSIEKPADERSVVNSARAKQRSGFIFRNEEYTDVESIKVNTLSLDQVDVLMTMIVHGVLSIREYRSRSGLESYTGKTRQAIRTAKILSNTSSKDINDNPLIAKTNALFNYATAYANWVRDPILPLVSMMVSVSRAIQALANKSISKYTA